MPDQALHTFDGETVGLAAGLAGSMGPKLNGNAYAALSVSLAVVKGQVALDVPFTLFDYTLNANGTISQVAAHVEVNTELKPLAVNVDLVLRGAYWKRYGFLDWDWSDWYEALRVEIATVEMDGIETSLLDWHQEF